MPDVSKPIAEMTDAERLAAPYVRDPELLPIGADPDGPRPYDPKDPRQRLGASGGSHDAPDRRTRRASVSLGRQLRAYRAAHGLTQRDVAERLGWDQPTVARLEAGLVTPNLATLALLSERLGVRLVLAPEAGGLLVTLEPLESVAAPARKGSAAAPAPTGAE
jgi:DNA-binding XRE family transcriptional regulator